ncbi:MAG TPA: hypothetical protein ENI60_03095 [Candidatus Fraserbacteria bacterium]|nr:hypothetical protein [Candidatus Fraserbacteria bacterium]
MKRLILLAVIVLGLSVLGVAPNAPYGGGVPAYASNCYQASPDGWIDWSGRDSDYLSAGHGIYYRFDLRCNTRVIISLSVPFFADFDLFLIEDTWPYENRLDSGDRGICSSRRGTGSNEYIDCRVPDSGTYFIYVAAYSGSGPYNISIKFDW